MKGLKGYSKITEQENTAGIAATEMLNSRTGLDIGASSLVVPLSTFYSLISVKWFPKCYF